MISKKSKKLVIVLLGILSIALAIIVMGPTKNQFNDQKGIEQKSSDPKEYSDQSDPQPVNIQSSDQEKQGTNSVDLEQNIFSNLIAEADSGDPAAQYEAYSKLSWCTGLDNESTIHSLINTSIEVGNPYTSDGEDYLWSMHSKCKTRSTISTESAKHYLSLAQQANHPAAVAHQLMENLSEKGLESSDEIALEILNSGDPEAIYNTRPYFYHRFNSLSAQQQLQAHSRDVVSAALTIWTCELGWDQCRGGSQMMLQNCFEFLRDNCDGNEGLIAYSLHASWTPDIERNATILAWEWQNAVYNGERPNIFTGEME